jgi:hypothetical protein
MLLNFSLPHALPSALGKLNVMLEDNLQESYDLKEISILN